MNQPIFKAKLGRVSGAVFRQEKDGNVWFSSQIVENYRDNDGSWRTTSSFNSGELGNLIAVSTACQQFI